MSNIYKGKAGIQSKAFIYMTGIFAIFLIIVILLCITTFEGFVALTRKHDIKIAYNQINKLSVEEYSEDSVSIRELTYKYNLRIIIMDEEFDTVFSNMFPEERVNFNNRLDPMMRDYIEELKDNDIKYKYINNNHKNFRNSFVTFIARLDSGYYLYVSIPLAYVKDNIRYMVIFISLLGVIALLLSAFVSYRLIRNLVKPVIEISKVTEKIASMDFSEKSTYSQNDELGTLSRNINTMSAKLKDNIDALKIEIEKERKIDDMRKNLIMNVSHELKTPIFLIQSYAEGLRENVAESPEDRNYYCNVIVEETARMDNMVKELLDLAKLEVGNVNLDIKRFFVSEIIDDFLTVNEITINSRNINVIKNYENISVYADIELAKRAVNNVIVNAIDHVNDGGLIRINAENKEKCCCISVYNSGSHIPEDDIDKIWDNFYKVEKSRNRMYGGTGIGLSIVKAVMQSHGGNYYVENADDGVLFCLEFPNI